MFNVRRHVTRNNTTSDWGLRNRYRPTSTSSSRVGDGLYSATIDIPGGLDLRQSVRFTETFIYYVVRNHRDTLQPTSLFRVIVHGDNGSIASNPTTDTLATYSPQDTWVHMDNYHATGLVAVTVKWSGGVPSGGAGSILNVTGIGSKAFIKTYDRGDNLCAPKSLVLLMSKDKHDTAIKKLKAAVASVEGSTLGAHESATFSTMLHHAFKPLSRNSTQEQHDKAEEYITRLLAAVPDLTRETIQQWCEAIADWDFLKRSRAKNQNSTVAQARTHRALELYRQAFPERATEIVRPATYEDLVKYSEVITANHYAGELCNIRVFDRTKQWELSTMTCESDEDVNETVHWFDLVLSAGHYCGVTKLHKLLGNQRHFCNRCQRVWSRSHNCPKGCNVCGHSNDHIALWKTTQDNSRWIDRCTSCHRKFYTQECFQTHLASGACGVVWKCVRCDNNFKTTGARPVTQAAHVCGQKWCTNCKQWIDPNTHTCFVSPKPWKATDEHYLFVDFETTQDSAGGSHMVNLAITQDDEGNEWPIHYTTKEWLDYLLEGPTDYSSWTVVAHNGKGYDFQFIIKQAVEHDSRQLTIVPCMQGTHAAHAAHTRVHTRHTHTRVTHAAHTRHTHARHTHAAHTHTHAARAHSHRRQGHDRSHQQRQTRWEEVVSLRGLA